MNTKFEGIKVLQPENGYRFTQDSVLLSDFVECNFNLPCIDLGTGSGIIPLLLSKRCKGKKIFGIELNAGLCEIAKENVKLNGKEKEIQIIHGNIKNIKDIFQPDSFDVVVTNPPYYSKDEGFISQNREKKMAKAEISMDLPLIFKISFYLLREKGNLYFIYPAKKLQSVFLMGRRFKFSPKKIRFVHYNIEREAELFLIKFGKLANEGLIVGPPVLIEEKKDL